MVAGEEPVFEKQRPAKSSGGFTRPQILVHMPFNYLSKQICADLLHDEEFYGLVYKNTNFTLSTKGDCAGEVINDFFHVIWDQLHLILYLQPSFISNNHLDRGGSGGIGLFFIENSLNLLFLNNFKDILAPSYSSMFQIISKALV